MPRVAPEDTSTISHIQYVTDSIHTFGDDLYEDLCYRAQIRRLDEYCRYQKSRAQFWVQKFVFNAPSNEDKHLLVRAAYLREQKNIITYLASLDTHFSPILDKRGRCMQKITIRLPQQQAEMLNLLVSTGEYTSVSEAIRAAIRDLIRSREDKLIERLDYLSKMS